MLHRKKDQQLPQSALDKTDTSKFPREVSTEGHKAVPIKQRATSEMQTSESNSASQTLSSDVAGQLLAQETELQQLRDALSIKQSQIDELRKDVAAFKESMSQQKHAPAEAFLEKNAVTAEYSALLSGGNSAREPAKEEDAAKKEDDPKNGTGADGGDKAPEAKSGSFFPVPCPFLTAVVTGLVATNV